LKDGIRLVGVTRRTSQRGKVFEIGRKPPANYKKTPQESMEKKNTRGAAGLIKMGLLFCLKPRRFGGENDSQGQQTAVRALRGHLLIISVKRKGGGENKETIRNAPAKKTKKKQTMKLKGVLFRLMQQSKKKA